MVFSSLVSVSYTHLKDCAALLKPSADFKRIGKVAVLPKSALAGENPEDMVCLACIRAKSNFRCV